MWQRFNYFLVLETALFGGKIYTDKSLQLNTGFILLGFFVSVCWYIMGSEDRYLVRVYRKTVEDVFEKIKNCLKIDSDYSNAGNIESEAIKKENSTYNLLTKIFNGWRIEAISTTHLAAAIPFVTGLAWLILVIKFLIF